MINYGTDRTLGYQRNPEFSSGNPYEKKENYSLHLSTIHLAGLHLLLSMFTFIMSVYLEVQWLAEENCRAYFIMIYIRSAFWIASCIINILITRQHNNLRRQGYHDFYRKKILTYKDVPLIIVTLWNMLMFLVQTILLQKYGSEFSLHCQTSVQSPSTYVCIFCGLETILLTIVHGVYIMKVHHFNNMHYLPDALRDIDQPFIGSLGVTVENGKVIDLLEKQEDLIYYLKEQNANLKQKLLSLNQRTQRTQRFGSYEKI